VLTCRAVRTGGGLRGVAEVHGAIRANLESVIVGKPQPIRWLLASFLSGGHVLLEDFPGTGKTTLAKALAKSVAADYKRVQFTPDLLPSDILGVSVYEQQTQSFRFHRGPVFCHILLGDEINRASPRTQSALLEAMGEQQVSIEGQRFALEDPFFVIATQNPVEFHGTYPLPEPQMDRFALRFSLGYLPAGEEAGMLDAHRTAEPIDRVQAAVSIDDVRHCRAAIRAVALAPKVRDYIVQLVTATRARPEIQLGASPRASLALMRTAQAVCAFDGLDYVTPDAVQELAVPVLAHRLALDPQARFAGRTAAAVVEDILKAVPVPG
jgi:MoxR-like ATPase